jgi:hypothetical protein
MDSGRSARTSPAGYREPGSDEDLVEEVVSVAPLPDERLLEPTGQFPKSLLRQTQNDAGPSLGLVTFPSSYRDETDPACRGPVSPSVRASPERARDRDDGTDEASQPAAATGFG